VVFMLQAAGEQVHFGRQSAQHRGDTARGRGFGWHLPGLDCQGGEEKQQTYGALGHGQRESRGGFIVTREVWFVERSCGEVGKRPPWHHGDAPGLALGDLPYLFYSTLWQCVHYRAAKEEEVFRLGCHTLPSLRRNQSSEQQFQSHTFYLAFRSA